MSDLRLYLFGLPRLEYQGIPVKIERRKALALVAFLALAEQRQSRDLIATLLWPDLDRDHGRSALRSTLRALTTPIPAEWIDSERTSLMLMRDALWVDVHAFTALLSGGDTHGHSPLVVCDKCVALYDEALALYQADFMAGFSLDDSVDYDDWQQAQRDWLRREFADIHRRLSVYYAEAQQYDQAIRYAKQWLVVDTLHEPAHRQLIRLYAANGQRSEALRQYHQAAEVLDTELATPPEDETTQLYESILNGQFSFSQSSISVNTQASSVLPPYPSLVIGRDPALNEIKRRLGIGGGETRGVTIIQGWPGVGKSTTVALLAHDQEIARQFPDGILWASLGENPSILSEISTWADALRINEPGRARKVEEISAQLTAALRDKRVLLIVDDVWDAEHAQPFRVGGQNCALVITSRLNDVASALAPTAFDLYHLPVLTDADALELLSKLTPEAVLEYPDEAQELVRDLEGLPLAVHVAGRLLHTESRLGWGIRELLAELRTGAGLLQARVPSGMIGAGRDTSPTVAALLKRSTDLLDREMRRRFAFLGLFVPKPATFDLEAMAVAWDVSDPRPVARVLVNRGLLEPVSGGRFQMHALLVLHARSLLEQEGLTL
ncbi:MAG: NB-ARC domain-containing protein [Anaerolineae bacterium]